MPESLSEQLPFYLQLQAQLESMVRHDLLRPAGVASRGPSNSRSSRALSSTRTLAVQRAVAPSN